MESALNNIQYEIIHALKKHGALTRREMVNKLSKPRTTIYDNIAVMVNMDMVRKFKKQINAKGRPHVFFALKEN